MTRLTPDLAGAGLGSEVDEALSKLDAIIEERRELDVQPDPVIEGV